MRRLFPIIILALLAIPSSAQFFKKKDKSVETIYQKGVIPVANGRVTFEETIKADGLTAAQVEERVLGWIKGRYVQPDVIASHIYDSDAEGTTVLRAEEYIVFTNKLFVLNRTRIDYYLTIEAYDGGCRFNMSRITYWYDEEADNGGMKMKAEEWITDDAAFKKNGNLKKFEGRFRRGTIDLKNQLIEELTKKLAE